MVDVVEDVAGKEAAEDEDWEPMAATITAAQALQSDLVGLVIDPGPHAAQPVLPDPAA